MVPGEETLIPTGQTNQLAEPSISGGLSTPNNSPRWRRFVRAGYNQSQPMRPPYEREQVTLGSGDDHNQYMSRQNHRAAIRRNDCQLGREQESSHATPQQFCSPGSMRASESLIISAPAGNRMSPNTGEEFWHLEMGQREAWEWLQEHYYLNPISIGNNHQGDAQSEISDLPIDNVYNAKPARVHHSYLNDEHFEEGLRPCIHLSNTSGPLSSETEQAPEVKSTDTCGENMKHAGCDSEPEEVEENTRLLYPVPTDPSHSGQYSLLEEFPRYKPQTSMIWPALAENCWGLQPLPQVHQGEVAVYNGPDPRYDLSGHLIDGVQSHELPSHPDRDTGDHQMSHLGRHLAPNLDPGIRDRIMGSLQTSRHQNHHITPGTTYPRSCCLGSAPSTPRSSGIDLPNSSPAMTRTNRQRAAGTVGHSPPFLRTQSPRQSPYLFMSQPRSPMEACVAGHTPCPETDERLAGLYPTGSPSVFWERPTLLHRQLHRNMTGALGRPSNNVHRSLSEPGLGRGSVTPSMVEVAPTRTGNFADSRYSPQVWTSTPPQTGDIRIDNMGSHSATFHVAENGDDKSTEPS